MIWITHYAKSFDTGGFISKFKENINSLMPCDTSMHQLTRPSFTGRICPAIPQAWLSGQVEFTPSPAGCCFPWVQDKMAAILQTTFSNAFSSIKTFEFWIKFHWNMFFWVLLKIWQPSYYLNQCWVIVSWTHRNKLQQNLYQNTKVFIHEKCIWNYCLRNGSHFVHGEMS